MQYSKLKEKTDRPKFEYVLLIDKDCSVAEDYYLFHYNEFEQAYDILKTQASKDPYNMSTLCEIGFYNHNRTYYLKPIFRIWDGKIIYDKYQDPLLHVLWHMNAGEWLNPRDDI